MIFINKFKDLGGKYLIFGKYSLYLNKVRKNLAAPGELLLPSPKAPTFGALPPGRRTATSL